MSTPANELIAPSTWRCIEFISDLHLAENTPKAFEAWRKYLLGTSANAIFILGDLFEAWIGDDARFEGFEARATAVLAEAAARKPIAFMIGNRDFLVGAEMLATCGVQALADPTLLCAFGQRALLVHGDAWCIADTDYQQFRRMVRNSAWQAQVLALPLAERRARASSMRSESERHAAERRGDCVDVDHAIAVEQLQAVQATTLVHGHTHRPSTEALAPGLMRHVLSDWDLDHADRAEVLRWSDGGVWTRLAPADAAR